MFEERAPKTAPSTPIGSSRTRSGRTLRTGLVVVATLLASCAALVVADAGPSAASTLNGVATTVNPSNGDFLASGGSDTPFTLSLPHIAACSGDTAHDGYNVWSYLVEKSAKIGSTTFSGASGPSQGYGLYDNTGTYYGPANTAINTGQVTQIPDFEWGPAIAGDGILSKILYTGKKSGIWEGGLACANSSGMLTDNWNVQFTFTKSTSDPNGFTWSAVPGPEGDTFATITSADSATFPEGSSGSFTPTASGTPTPTITERGTLPTGVTFSGGELTGNPTQSGSFPITFTATNGIGNPGTQAFTLNVAAPFEITTMSLPAATIGTAYSATVAASGGTKPYSWKAKGLPKGLKISKTTGVIAGKPAAKDVAKTYSVAVTVTDKAKPKGTATKTLSLVLNAA